jgi:indolepyruvate ferredoxin oxidoreductase beta subunit
LKLDILIAGLGGQSEPSLARRIGKAAMEAGLKFRLSEGRGSALEGGAQVTQIRISDKPIACDLVPQGGAGILIALEALEGLRYAAWLATNGLFISASETVPNIADYPEAAAIYGIIDRFPNYRLVKSAELEGAVAEALREKSGGLLAIE